MGDGNVVVFDETSPLTQSHRNILSYQTRPEDTTTFLIELPEVQPDAPRPSTQPSSRPRRSTIIDLQQPVSKEAELDPLQDYVRRNLSSFRRSITPEDVQFTRGWPAEEAEVVNPKRAEDPESDLMDSKKQTSRERGESDGSESDNRRENKQEDYPHRKRHSSEGKTKKGRGSNASDRPIVSKGQKHRESTNYEDFTMDRDEKMNSKYKKKGERQTPPRHELVVMPALEPVSVDQKSPFTKEKIQQPIKIKLSVEPSKEQVSSYEKSGNRHHSKRKNSDLRHREKSKNHDRRKKSRESSTDFIDEENTLPTKHHKKRKSLRKSDDLRVDPKEDAEERRVKSENRQKTGRQAASSNDKRDRKKSRESSGRSSQDDEPLQRKSDDKRNRCSSSSVCLSGASDGNSSDPNINKRSPRKGNSLDTSGRSSKNRTSLRKQRSSDDRSLNRDDNRSPRSSAAKNRDSVNVRDHSKTKHPFGKEESYAVHYVATENKTKKAGPGSKKMEGEVDPNRQKYMTAKAPRSATKIMARRRYHIQIPEHGRPETWFNVRFNMNDDNNVDMNYEGPVKINNYYVSNNYT